MSVQNAEPPLPWRYVVLLCLCDSTHFYTVCSLFSYAGVMSADLKWVPDRNAAGFVAGWLQSANVFGRVLTSSVWGLVACRYGFKPVLLITLSGLSLGGIAFGVCTNLALALLIRSVFFGALNGWVVLFGPCAADVAGDDRQTEVVGLVMATGAFIQLIGPAIGGWTYGMVPALPAVVPSLLGSAFACVALLVCWVVMPSSAGRPSVGAPALSKKPSKPSLEEEEESLRLGQGPAPPAASGRSARLSWPMPLILLMRLLHGLTVFGIFEAAPIWAISAEELGGLGLSEKEVGSLLSRSAIWNVVYFSYLMPRGSKLIGSRRFAILASIVAGSTAAALPWSPGVVTANVLHMLSSSTSISEGAMCLAFTNNAVDVADRPAVNGIAVTVETVGKAVGPVGMSAAFAWSLKAWGRQGHSAVFLLMAAMHAIYCLGAMCLPPCVETAEFLRSRAGHVPVAVKEEVPPCVLGSSTLAAGGSSEADGRSTHA